MSDQTWPRPNRYRSVMLGVPYLWLLIFFGVPCLIVVGMSFALSAASAPPFVFANDWPYIRFDNFDYILSDPIYLRAFLISAMNAGITTLCCLLFGYPIALAITRTSRTWRPVFLMLLILPFWVSFLLRVYAWMGLLSSQSWLNGVLTDIANLFLPASAALDSITLMNTNFAVIVVMTYSYLPLAVLPLYAALERLDPALNEAAGDLGAAPWQVFRDVTLPISMPGIIAASLLTFIPASGELVIPTLVGDPSYPMIGRVISAEFTESRDWPLASAVAVALLVALLIPILFYIRAQGPSRAGERGGP